MSCVVVSVLAIMQINEWGLGVAESIAVVMHIGLSVDYVVHLSADYMHSKHKTRFERMKQSYSHMGISVFSGTVTTLGSGIFLFGGELIFFKKFALLITGTISISFLVSMLYFGALCHVFGP